MPKQVTNVASDDALTTIYRLSYEEREPVIAARIAERLGVKAPSVAAMLGRLRRDGLLRFDSRKRISLTPSGRARAKRMVRRHRLAECLLVQVLGLDWWRAYEEAHLLEHAISEVTEPLIDTLLGHPQLSPFGCPIPGAGGDGELSPRHLSDLSVQAHATLQRVYEENEELLRFLDQSGMRPGAELEVIEVARYLGTLTVRIGDDQVVLGLEAARGVWVI
jgi:DtxR family Mn-dependent transcriptional regulator